MSSFHQLVRTNNWFQWKTSPLLTVGYTTILMSGIKFWTGLQTNRNY